MDAKKNLSESFARIKVIGVGGGGCNGRSFFRLIKLERKPE